MKGKTSLANVSFAVPRGQIFGFLGANGAGKTTAIKIALGLQRATSGQVKLFGEDCSVVANRARLGYLPERPYFHTNLTAEESLDFHRSLYGAPVAGARPPSNEELLRKVGLADARHTYLRNFSKGMLQRIGIAQALLNDPELVILDEPMSGLDPVGRREVRNLLHDLHRSGKTIFFSSHILSDVESLCQRIAFLEKGVLKYLGDVSQLINAQSSEYEILLRSGAETKRLLLKGNAEARAAVERAWAEGQEVMSFAPAHRSLEDALFGEKK